MHNVIIFLGYKGLGLASLNLTNIQESDRGWYNCKVRVLILPFLFLIFNIISRNDLIAGCLLLRVLNLHINLPRIIIFPHQPPP